jgi:LmbE family N-acetylglucosaminyl deacetylase
MALQTDNLLRWATAPEGDESPLSEAVLVFAHPDDEVIAVGARLGRFRQSRFVHVTDGAPRNEQDSRAHGFSTLDAYRQTREGEMRTVFQKAGVCAAAHECFGIPDQEASLSLPELVRRLHIVLKASRPDVVFTHPYEGGHPDHDACAFGVRHAIARLKAEGSGTPLIVEAVFYHAGPHGIETGGFLAHPQTTEEVSYTLSDAERNRKRELLDCFTTQRETLQGFGLACERFRIAPDYDFTRLPHEAPLFYDHFPWGMKSDRFRELARSAIASINQENVATCD